MATRSFLIASIVLLLTSVLHATTGTSHKLQSQEEGLGTPGFWDFVTGIYEKEIVLGYINPNENSQTEIWISRLPDDGFVLARVEGPAEGQQVYYDDTRSPRTKYYFKLRAIRGDLKSDFSPVTSFTTGSEFFTPTIEAKAKDAETIEITFQDRSYNDVSYTIWKEGAGPEFRVGFSASDSGRVFHFTDEFLEPGQTYVYWVDAYTQGPNMPRYLSLVSATTSTPAAPILFGFSLIDADRDAIVADLSESTEVVAPEHPNIVAFANEETESVVFVLNGKKRTENVPPYAYFYDTNGDFKAGKLTPGKYELSATPFSGNNGTGTAGNTMSVSFTVSIPNEHLDIERFTLVDPSNGTDIKELRDGDEVDASSRPNIRAHAGTSVSSVVFRLNGAMHTENEAPYAYFLDANGVYRPGRLSPGHYVLEATGYSDNNGTGQAGATKTIEFTVIEPLTDATLATMSLYPNPATTATTLELSAPPGSPIVIDIRNAQGNRYTTLYNGVIDHSGSFRKEFDVHMLQKGTYFFIIRLNEALSVRRFALIK